LAIAIQQSTLFEQAQTELAERKRAEEKLREQAALLNVATDAIFVRDLENKIYSGIEALSICTAGRKMKPGRMPTSFCKEPSLQLKEAFQTVVLAGEWYGDYRTKNKEIIVESRWTLVRDRGGATIINTHCRHRHHREETIRSAVSPYTATGEHRHLAKRHRPRPNNVLAPL